MKKIKHIVSIAVIILLTATAGVTYTEASWNMDGISPDKIQEAERLANNGSAKHMYVLSLVYYYKDADDKKAAEWLQKAIDQQENKEVRCHAQIRRAWVLYQDDRDHAGSLRILRQAKSEGCSIATNILQTWEENKEKSIFTLGNAALQNLTNQMLRNNGYVGTPWMFLGYIEATEKNLTKLFGDARNIQSSLVGGTGFQRSYSYGTFIRAFRELHRSLSPDDYRRLMIITADASMNVDQSLESPELWNFPIAFANNLTDVAILFPALKTPQILQNKKIYAKLVMQLFTQDIDGAIATIRSVPDVFIRIARDIFISNKTMSNMSVLNYFQQLYGDDFIKYISCEQFGCDKEKAKAWGRRSVSIHEYLWGEPHDNDYTYAQFAYFDHFVRTGVLLKSKKGN